MKTYSTTGVAARSGATFRQLDYWVRTGLIEPSVPARGSGRPRTWSEDDLAEVELIVALLDVGMTLDTIRRKGPRRAAKELRRAAELVAGAA